MGRREGEEPKKVKTRKGARKMRKTGPRSNLGGKYTIQPEGKKRGTARRSTKL